MENVLIGMLIPFLGTSLGSACVFFMRDKRNDLLKKFLLGISAGIMVSASIWSLILPAIDQSEANGELAFLPASIGVILGFALLFFMQKLNDYFDFKKQETNIGYKQKKSLMVFSITLHNIPEGMAVGVAFAGVYFGNSLLTLSSAIMLSIGIAIQNMPEGAIVSVPYKIKGKSKFKAFMMGVYSGLVEPISALIAFFITGFVSAILPYVLAFAGGTMLFVVVEEIIPEAQNGKGKSLATLGFMIGFLIMMILDVMLG